MRSLSLVMPSRQTCSEYLVDVWPALELCSKVNYQCGVFFYRHDILGLVYQRTKRETR